MITSDIPCFWLCFSINVYICQFMKDRYLSLVFSLYTKSSLMLVLSILLDVSEVGIYNTFSTFKEINKKKANFFMIKRLCVLETHRRQKCCGIWQGNLYSLGLDSSLQSLARHFIFSTFNHLPAHQDFLFFLYFLVLFVWIYLSLYCPRGQY